MEKVKEKRKEKEEEEEQSGEREISYSSLDYWRSRYSGRKSIKKSAPSLSGVESGCMHREDNSLSPTSYDWYAGWKELQPFFYGTIFPLFPRKDTSPKTPPERKKTKKKSFLSFVKEDKPHGQQEEKKKKKEGVCEEISNSPDDGESCDAPGRGSQEAISKELIKGATAQHEGEDEKEKKEKEKKEKEERVLNRPSTDGGESAWARPVLTVMLGCGTSQLSADLERYANFPFVVNLDFCREPLEHLSRQETRSHVSSSSSFQELSSSSSSSSSPLDSCVSSSHPESLHSENDLLLRRRRFSSSSFSPSHQSGEDVSLSFPERKQDVCVSLFLSEEKKDISEEKKQKKKEDEEEDERNPAAEVFSGDVLLDQRTLANCREFKDRIARGKKEGEQEGQGSLDEKWNATSTIASSMEAIEQAVDECEEDQNKHSIDSLERRGEKEGGKQQEEKKREEEEVQEKEKRKKRGKENPGEEEDDEKKHASKEEEEISREIEGMNRRDKEEEEEKKNPIGSRHTSRMPLYHNDQDKREDEERDEKEEEKRRERCLFPSRQLYIQADARRVPLRDSCADLVVDKGLIDSLRSCKSVTERLSQIADVLKEVGRLLACGGVYVVISHSLSCSPSSLSSSPSSPPQPSFKGIPEEISSSSFPSSLSHKTEREKSGRSFPSSHSLASSSRSSSYVKMLKTPSVGKQTFSEEMMNAFSSSSSSVQTDPRELSLSSSSSPPILTTERNPSNSSSLSSSPHTSSSSSPCPLCSSLLGLELRSFLSPIASSHEEQEEKEEEVQLRDGWVQNSQREEKKERLRDLIEGDKSALDRCTLYSSKTSECGVCGGTWELISREKLPLNFSSSLAQALKLALTSSSTAERRDKERRREERKTRLASFSSEGSREKGRARPGAEGKEEVEGETQEEEDERLDRKKRGAEEEEEEERERDTDDDDKEVFDVIEVGR
ncbi:hypothetical protein CSUI_005109 [Cystoisospora suis]|uniref:Methyltransferase domain-containing protein n=1 Tax=Cystoisospora suis TaxID=483139 RepID=A0A2C6KY79_9APIC|nr:hypothetical protein CSUI_005109 [Cystoisospora suis]